jgi:hypothetical protein
MIIVTHSREAKVNRRTPQSAGFATARVPDAWTVLHEDERGQVKASRRSSGCSLASRIRRSNRQRISSNVLMNATAAIQRTIMILRECATLRVPGVPPKTCCRTPATSSITMRARAAPVPHHRTPSGGAIRILGSYSPTAEALRAEDMHEWLTNLQPQSPTVAIDTSAAHQR